MPQDDATRSVDTFVVNAHDAPQEGGGEAPWNGFWRVLTPGSRERSSLGVAQNTLPPGGVGCPFHWHAREDEVFFVLSGRGVLRIANAPAERGSAGTPESTVRSLRPGDCVEVPAGTRRAHQIANPHDEDLVYLSIGTHDPDEVCGYPDNGKVLVRTLDAVGRFEPREYMDGEPAEPAVFRLWSEKLSASEDS